MRPHTHSLYPAILYCIPPAEYSPVFNLCNPLMSAWGSPEPPNCNFLQVFVGRAARYASGVPGRNMKGLRLPGLGTKKALASESLLKHLNSPSSRRVSPSVSTFQTTSLAPSNPTR
jgi:hypothetical protein